MPRPNRKLIHADITYSIVGAFFELYNALGFGFLESVYSAGMERLLRERGLHVEREVLVPVYLNGRLLAKQRVDMLVERCVIVENKSTYRLPRITPRQTYSYVHATKLEVAMVLHFGPKAKFYRIESLNE